MNALPVVYENDEILVINKPCGLAVQGGQGVTASVDRVLPEQVGYPVYLVHRLDKETAGLLVVAKSSAAAGRWTRELNAGKVRKVYQAWCLGCPKSKKGTFTEKVQHKDKSQNAVTHYQVLKSETVTLEDGSTLELSLLQLTLETGRMHQIRIHLAQAGFPICADDKYGNFKANKILQKQLKVKRLQLAACQLTIPVGGKMETFTVEQPPHFLVI